MPQEVTNHVIFSKILAKCSYAIAIFLFESGDSVLHAAVVPMSFLMSLRGPFEVAFAEHVGFAAHARIDLRGIDSNVHFGMCRGQERLFNTTA